MKVNLIKLSLFLVILAVLTSKTQATASSMSELYDKCRSGEGGYCLVGAADNCLEKQNCDFILASEYQDGAYEFTIAACSADDTIQYVVAGFSHDQKMGDDLSVDCIKDGLGSSEVNVYLGSNIAAMKDHRRATRYDANLENLGTRSEDGSFLCNFRILGQLRSLNTTLDLAQKSYYLLVAWGKIQPDSLLPTYHTNKIASAEKHNFASGVGEHTQCTIS